ncbi:MAG: M20/M25/M40 family metallo-hydrolase [Cytophagales bacterium]|nr:M20/M25/M40 family metallo-hydrolase [Cytophagales bacterium]
MDLELLNRLTSIHSPSGEEFRMKEFLVDYVRKNQSKWKCKPIILEEPRFGDGFILVFGEPKTVVLAHMDTIGFMVRYGNQLIPIGGPQAETGYRLNGTDSLGPVTCQLQVDKEHNLFHDFPRAIERGTSLAFSDPVQVDKNEIQGPYLDNRLGLYTAMKVAETLENGALAFSCFEEIGGGNVPALLDALVEKYPVRQALISDITWVTEGVKAGEGVAISIRDENIPRRAFVNRIIKLAEQSGINYQLEVEGGGSSDGAQVRHSRHGLDWCFIGAPENNVHSPKECVQVADLEAMVALYSYLLQAL